MKDRRVTLEAEVDWQSRRVSREDAEEDCRGSETERRTGRRAQHRRSRRLAGEAFWQPSAVAEKHKTKRASWSAPGIHKVEHYITIAPWQAPSSPAERTQKSTAGPRILHAETSVQLGSTVRLLVTEKTPGTLFARTLIRSLSA